MIRTLLLILFMLNINNLFAEVPCDFKGINVGDRLSTNEIMSKLDVKKFTTNPKRPSFEETLPLQKDYGLIGASEITDWNLGPYCTEKYCRIPGVYVGDNIPSSIFVSFDSKTHQVKAIDVTVNQLDWADLVQIIKRKYGTKNWKSETEPLYITDYKTKKGMTIHREILTNAVGGINPRTNTQCTFSAIQFDMIFTHGDPLGLYHSVFEIKLTSENF